MLHAVARRDHHEAKIELQKVRHTVLFQRSFYIGSAFLYLTAAFPQITPLSGFVQCIKAFLHRDIIIL